MRLHRLAVIIVLFSSFLFVFYRTHCIVSATEEKQEENENINFRWAFCALRKRGPDQELFKITGDTTLRTGDKIKMFLELRKECFLYVIYHGSQGELRLLFPYHLRRSNSYYRTGEKYYIPKGQGWFELDDRVGRETFFLLASAYRVTKLEGLIEDYESAEPSKKQKLATSILDEVRKVKREHSKFKTTAERPVAVVGRIRGGRETDIELTTEISKHAIEVAAYNFYTGLTQLSTNRKRKLTTIFLLALGSLLTAHLCFWLLPNVFGTWNAQTIDRLFALRSSSRDLRPRYDNTIVHLDITNSTLHRLKNAYLDRSHFAKAMRNLSSMNVVAQGYDFIFAAPLNEDSDRALIDATEKAGNVYFGMAFNLRGKDQRGREQLKSTNTRYLDQTKWHVKVEGNPDSFYEGIDPLLTFPELASAARGLGSLSVKFDRDGVLRRVPLLLRYNDAFYPILPFRIICGHLRVPPERIIVRPGKHLILQGAQGPESHPPRDIVIPIDMNGNMVVNYIGPWEHMDHYNFADILLSSEDKDVLEMWREELKGKIVVISDVSTGSSDIGPVPTDPNFPLGGLLSNVMNTILTRAFIRELPDSQMLIIELLLISFILVLSLRFTSHSFFLGTLGVALGYSALVGIFFFYGKVIFNVIRPLSMVILAVISIAIYRYINEEKEKLEGLRERDFIRQTFGRYLSNEVVEELLGSPDGLKMSGETREVTLLVSDLRGFATISAQLMPPDVITMLNRYFEHMLDIIARYRGTVNELQGDGILAFFGAPLIADDDPERAIACAIEMQNAMVEINEEQRRCHLPELAMGIGINSGEVVVGNIGSEKRAKYSAVGSAINIAHRIETYTVGGQILISSETYNRVRSLVHTRGTLGVEFKGCNQPVTLYDVIGINGKYQLYLNASKSDTLTKLKIPLRISCYPLIGKTVSKESIPSQIISFSKSRAEALLEGRAELHTNLKILLAPRDVPSLPEVYAKIISINKPDSSALPIKTTLEFTWLPEDARNWLAERSAGGERVKE